MGNNPNCFPRFSDRCCKQNCEYSCRKVTKAIDLIHVFLYKPSEKITVHMIQKLCGFLNYLCRCIVPGRAFTRRLYAFTSVKGKVLLPHHHVRVTMEMRADLTTWLTFLQNPKVYSRPFMDYDSILNTTQLDWYTDASGNYDNLGFRGYFGPRWFYHRWITKTDEKNSCIRSNLALST